MEARVVYDDKKDRELLNLIDSKFPIFIDYINFNTVVGRKEAYRVKSHWGAIKNPFVVITEGDNVIDVFYSEKDNAVNQLINFLNGSFNQETE